MMNRDFPMFLFPVALMVIGFLISSAAAVAAVLSQP